MLNYQRVDCDLNQSTGQGWAQIVAFLGTYELFINKPVGVEPGNYGGLDAAVKRSESTDRELGNPYDL